MRRLAIICTFLVGCSSIPPVIIEEPATMHPTFPTPYSVCPIDWEVHNVGGRAKIALSYDDNITAAICDRDKDRYIKQLINLACFYRQDRAERICKGANDD